MHGISEDVILHKINDDSTFKCIHPKSKYFSPEKEIPIKDEVEKLLKAGIIKEISYPMWLANVVMVKKANDKWSMCVDFTDLNKACPKDCFPLHRINRLVDSIADHRVLSFIDAYFGYHQIKMAPEDVSSVAFTAVGKTYCYTMTPFGLKNAGATYQRMVNIVFKDQLGRNLEAYIDNTVIKTKENSHELDVEETFSNLRRNNIKLNPLKCAFGVKAGKFLGFMVSQRGIEDNPKKIQALMDMKPPACVKDVQKLNGRITSLGRFITQSAERCLPFFKTLKGGRKLTSLRGTRTAIKLLKK